MRTRAGVSRMFGFVGYSSEEEAEAAQAHFDATFMGMCRIVVHPAHTAHTSHI